MAGHGRFDRSRVPNALTMSVLTAGRALDKKRCLER